MFSSEEEEEEDEQQSQNQRGFERDGSPSSQHLRGSSAQTDNNSSEQEQDQDQDDMEIERDDDEGEDEDEEGEEGDDDEDENENDDDSDNDDDDDEDQGEADGQEEEEEDEEDENLNRSNAAEEDGHRPARTEESSQPDSRKSPPPPSTSPSLSHNNSQVPSETIDQSTRLDLKPPQSPLPNTYRQQILQRHQIVTQPRKFERAPTIDPLVFIPHGCPVHALAVPPCGTHLFSGGQDGFVRRIAIHESVTGSGLENLTMKQGGHVPLVDKDTDRTTIFLAGYWENDDQNSLLEPASPNPPLKWGPKSVGNATQVSPVYSLAIHDEELWGLSGTELGNINLFTIRHDEGHIRHVFKAANPPSAVPLTSASDVKGHKPGSVISALALNSDQNIAFSGGWDGIVLGWDLNTGQVVNKFIAHASQISTVALRPDSRVPIYDTKFEENLMEREEKERRIDRSEQANEQEVKSQKEDVVEDTEMRTAEAVEPAHDASAKTIEEKGAEATATSSPDRPLASDIAGDEDSEEDGSLFGGADNSGSEGEDSPEASVPLAMLSPGRGKGGGGGGLILPTASGGDKPTAGPPKPTAPPLILPTVATSKARNVLPLMKKPVLPATNLTQVPSVLDSSLPVINDDVLMTSGIDGQVYLWDRRVSGSGSAGYVRKLDLPKATSPWTASASWSIDGRSVFVGRRNHSVDLYDLRFLRPNSPIFNPDAIQRSIKLPPSSGPVSCVKPWPDGSHLLCASFDNLRLYNLNADLHPTSLSSARKSTHHPPKIPFKIIPGHSSGVVSQMCVTPSFRFLITASGDRGWQSTSNESVVIHEIRAPSSLS